MIAPRRLPNTLLPGTLMRSILSKILRLRSRVYPSLAYIGEWCGIVRELGGTLHLLIAIWLVKIDIDVAEIQKVVQSVKIARDARQWIQLLLLLRPRLP